MAIEPGDVVTLKSGGQSMTVAAVEESSVECIWMGDNGVLYRETVPDVTLTVIASEEDEDDEAGDEEDNHEEEEEEEEEPKTKRSIVRST
jgi:uncharacterized protein YodC (DUF2158 family)